MCADFLFQSKQGKYFSFILHKLCRKVKILTAGFWFFYNYFPVISPGEPESRYSLSEMRIASSMSWVIKSVES